MATINTNLEQPPYRIPIYDSPGVMNSTWVRWFQGLFDRVGGPSGNIIYDTADSSQTVASLEPQLFAIRAEIEQQLTGVMLSIIEQIQEQIFDPVGLISDIAPEPAPALPPEEFNYAGVAQQAYDSAPVQTVFGRLGHIGAVDGDYSLDLLGDVSLTAPTTGQALVYNGTLWVNTDAVVAIAVSDKGTALTPAVTSFDFVGPYITATSTGSAVTVTVDTTSTATSPVFTYSGGLLTNITFSDATYMDFTYIGGILNTINNGITLKTFNYTAGVLTSITET